MQFCGHLIQFDSGVAVYVLGDHTLYGGVLRITLDGEPAQSIDLYGAVTCGEVLFSRTGLANGQHSIDLELAGMSPNVTPTIGYPHGLFVLTNFMCVFSRPPTAPNTVNDYRYTILDPTDSTGSVSNPTSTLSSGSVPIQTAAASGPAQDLSKVQKLWTCRPYGPNDCVFSPRVIYVHLLLTFYSKLIFIPTKGSCRTKHIFAHCWFPCIQLRRRDGKFCYYTWRKADYHRHMESKS
jgi:hypothetical protein